MVEDLVRPRGPFSLRVSAWRAGDATRRFDGRILVMLFETSAGLERAAAWQRPDGSVELRAAGEEALAQLRFVLPLDADHSEFVERFCDDPLLGRSVKELRGLRPLRLATVTHALLRALCGQLVDWKRARNTEVRLIRGSCDSDGRFHVAPTRACFAAAAPAELQRAGLSARKAATLVRVCRTLDLERLRAVSPAGAAARLERERGLGPWSVGVIGLEGLGCYDFGLVGDLGLIKLCTALLGRRADPADTAELLAPYGRWQGLASTYLLSGFARGLLPVRYERVLAAA